MSREPDTYIWINNWETYQTFHRKRGKPWTPPWIRLYPRLLHNDDFLRLSGAEQLLLLKLFMLFSSSRQVVSNNTRSLSQLTNQRVLKSHIESLNHAGFITICSRTVLERVREQFWSCSRIEVEVDLRSIEPPPDPNRSTYTLNGALPDSDASVELVHDVLAGKAALLKDMPL